MDIIGQSVRHDTLGNGKVTAFTGNRVSVLFDKKESESRFVFPEAFGERLRFIDNNVQKQVETLINQIKIEKTRDTKPVVSGSKKPSISAPTYNKSDPIPAPKVASRLNSFLGEVIPSSAVLQAEICGERKRYNVLIVSDQSQQSSSQGVYWKNRELSKKILEAHFSDGNRFTFDGKEYTIENVRKHVKYASVKSQWNRLNNISEAKELYIFKQKGIYDNPENGYELVDARLYFPEKLQAIKVAVYYQASQSRFFMNEESYMPLVRSYGIPNVQLHYTDDVTPSTSWAGTFNEVSKLKRLGYSVQQADGLSDGERQTLLSSIIRSGQMTDAEVTNHLEMLIHLNSGKTNMANACGAWRTDLKFVQDNFGDMRKQKDLYGQKTSATDITRKPSERPKKTTGSTVPKSTVKKTSTGKKASTKRSRSESKAAKQRKALEDKRVSLYAELNAATGIFNFFKRVRIKREIRDVEDRLRS